MSAPPLEVRLLKDYIKDWKKIYGGILMSPKDHLHFDKLLLQSRYLLFDNLFDFSGIIEIISEEKMSDDFKRLYQILVELQCELSWEGFLKRKPYFKSYGGITKLKEHISNIGVNKKLINMLNSSNDVLRLIRKIRPYELFVILSNFIIPLGFEDNPIQAHAQNYYNPSEIVWVISISINGSRLGGYKKRFINVCELMESIARIVLKVTNSISVIKND